MEMVHQLEQRWRAPSEDRPKAADFFNTLYKIEGHVESGVQALIDDILLRREKLDRNDTFCNTLLVQIDNMVTYLRK